MKDHIGEGEEMSQNVVFCVISSIFPHEERWRFLAAFLRQFCVDRLIFNSVIEIAGTENDILSHFHSKVDTSLR
jgi:hypothetical protein